MALNYDQLVALGKATINASANSPVAYSFGENKFSSGELNDLFRKELNELAGTYALYRENKNKIFSLMEEMIEDVLPKKVMEQYSQFAEIKTFAQGDKPVFTQRITEASKQRAKKFVTKVGLAGIYEVFKLDGRSYEVATSAYGGAAQIAFEEFLDGRVQMSDVLDIVLEGLDEAVYREIANALAVTAANIQATNKFTDNNFTESNFDTLLQIADAYGQSAIYCTFEFAAKMLPAQNYTSDAMKDTLWNNGYLGNYKGHKVIVLQQSFVDTTNTKKVVDPSIAYILPVAGEKPVKIALEGGTIVRDIDNADMSKEIQIYKKMGVACIATPNMCVYTNKSLQPVGA